MKHLTTCIVALLLLPGCNGDLDATELPETAPCVASPASLDRYAGLTPASGVDGIAFFYADEPQGLNRPEVVTLGAAGKPCSGARDRDACQREVTERSLQATSGWNPPDSGAFRHDRDFGFVTRGDAVVPIATLEELRVAVAPLETVEEAVAWFQVNRGPLRCGDRNLESASDGWVFRVESTGCGHREHFFKLTRDGAITLTRERALEAKPAPCPLVLRQRSARTIRLRELA
ncbi:MAG: hypothetical protein IPG50_30630 [Myxococcales bacterium]|nr:hypothetical protein [Myxococcales bacterium]